MTSGKLHGAQSHDGSESSAVQSPVYQRESGVVWRLGVDRVLVRRVGAAPEGAASELFGAVALLWIALDEPATLDEIGSRLAEADVVIDDLVGELDRLIAADLVERA